MNDFKRTILQGHEHKIYEDVTDPTDIVTYLQSKNIILPHEKQILSSSQNLTEKLVKILLKKDDGNWFQALIEALDKDFGWISNSMKLEFESGHDKRLTYYLQGRGNVPPLPQHNITRLSDVEKLRGKIRDLRRDSYLVVHGMSGVGKTCLVVDALHDISLLENSLNGCVYWLSVGDLRDDDPDDLQCHQLQQKLCEMVKPPINNQKDLQLALKNYFSLEPNFNALLVLDKVRTKGVVDAMKIGCKILVTTQDTDVVRMDSRKILFPVRDGFSENETVELLQDFVHGEQGTLRMSMRDSAVKIHRAWRGHPMVIGLIGGELSEVREESQNDLSRWKEYERTLKPLHKSNERRRSVFEEQINSIIGLSIDKLKEKDKKLFNMLAVFVEDTNITTDVLEILWQLSNSEVQYAIDHFYRRSLVFKKFNPDLKKAVYGIHDFIIEYLKKGLTELELKVMHQDLILKYHTACEGNLANLPQDNYIFSYLCHHIDKGEKWNDFRDQFFCLQYIGSKLKATSPADLLLDLCKYYSGLVGSASDYHSRVEDVKKFVNDSGWDIHQGEVDVLQCALLQLNSSFVFKQAASKIRPSKIYFLPLSSPERKSDIQMNVSSVSAVCIINHTSVPPAQGRILIYPDEEEHVVEVDMNYRRNRRIFKEKSKVNFIKMSPLYDKFLTALEDGQIHIWNLHQSESNANTPPPSLKQKSYLSNYHDMRTMPLSTFRHSRRVTCVCFSSDGKLVVSSSDDGTVQVWSLEDDKNEVSRQVHPDPIATSCCFLNGNSTIVYGCQNLRLVFFSLKTKEDYCYDLSNNYGPILDLLCVPDESRKLIVVQERHVQLLMWEGEILKHRREGTRPKVFVNVKTRVLYDGIARINCAVYHHKHLLLLGTSDGCMLLSDIFSDNVTYSKYGSGNINAVDMKDERIVFAESNAVKMCWPKPGQRNEVSLLSAHLGWMTSGDISVLATISSHGNLQVYHNGKLTKNFYDQLGCVVRVSTFGQQVLMGTFDGRVFLCDTINEKIFPLGMKFYSKIHYLSIGMYNYLEPVYLASAKCVDEESYTLQAGFHVQNKMRILKEKIPVPVVKTFICSKRYLLIVLQNYTILASELVTCETEVQRAPFHVQEGRRSAIVTDACLSVKEDILLLSDEEMCFHVIKLRWPHDDTENSKLIVRVKEPSRPLTLSLPPDIRKAHAPQVNPQPIDEVDGMNSAMPPECSLTATLNTYPLSAASRCCCICPKGHIAAIGYDDLTICIWDLQYNKEIREFLLPDRSRRICQMKFSPYGTTLGGLYFDLVLCTMTDCVSLWDLSPFINGKSVPVDSKPQCIGCVTAGGNPLIELSINQSFTKFSAYDEEGSFFLWKVWEENNIDNDGFDVNKNGIFD